MSGPCSSFTAPRLPDLPRPANLFYPGGVKSASPSDVDQWVRAVEARHSTELSFQEIRRGIQALSWRYVERRAERGLGATLDGRGKRAAFALFYAPLHLIVVRHIVEALQSPAAAPPALLDLGCGTGVGAAAWTLASEAPRPALTGVDVHPWAVAECRWNWRSLGLRGHVRRADLRTLDPGDLSRAGVVAAFAFNEIPGEARDRWLRILVTAPRRPARLLVVEPIARRAAPWWDTWATAVTDAGGRADTWELHPALPDPLPALDKAAGLSHKILKARSLWL